MKSAILGSLLCAGALLVEASHSGHHNTLHAFRRHESAHKRHAHAHTHALTQRSSSAKMVKKKRTILKARKTPGIGDFTTEPDSIAPGTFTSKQGCAIWHVVQEGEVCLGLIDKSSADFTLDKFLKFNPSINSDCSNLIDGLAYCVDTVVDGQVAKTEEKATAPAKVQLAAPATDSKQVQADAGSADEEEDCEEDDDVAADDDEDCEEEDDDSADTVISVKTKTTAPKVAAPVAEQKKQPEQAQPAPVEEKKQAPSPAAQAPSPTSTYVAPSPYPSPSPQPKPEPKPEEQPQQNNGGGDNGNWQQTNMQATYYYQNGNAGSCGNYGKDSDMIVAVKSDIMGSQLCGKQVKLRNTATGKVVTATVADTCPTCVGLGIDLSEGLFKALSPNGLGPGVLNVDYSIL